MNVATETATTLYGHRITFFKDDYIGRKIRQQGIYEQSVLRFLVPLLERMKGPVVLDIGANIGNHTLALSTSSSAIYAFEPTPEIFRLLSENIAQNNLAGVRAINKGLSDHNGQASIHIHRSGNLGATSLYQRAEGTEEMTVDLVRGDDIVAELGIEQVDFIKLDVEGHEPNVLNGLAGTLARCRPLIMMEWNDEETASRIVAEKLFGKLFADYDCFVLGNNRDPAYWEGRILARVRRRLTRWFLPKRTRLYRFDPARVYKNILLVPAEKRGWIPQRSIRPEDR